MSAIRLIALDIDGTLFNSQHQITPLTEQSLIRAYAQGIQIVFATGKTRYSVEPLLARLGWPAPGVFVQGLLVVKGDGSTLYQRLLEPEVAQAVTHFADEKQCPMVAYAGQRLLTNIRDEFTDIFIRYHEPTPEAFGSWSAVLSHTAVNKFILVHTPETINQLRPKLEKLTAGRATIVQALPNMVEVLPPGASKGDGLRRLLAHLQVRPEEVLAIGDGENDIEMLQMAGIGVAMGNAMPSAKAAADYVTLSNDEDGVAHALQKFIGEI
jgi:Cof subfamily protein (haloacid dehalogenase superfamily)